jgi:hypothetical protein
MRRPYVVVSLSVLLVLILLAPNILMAQPVETEHSIEIDASKGVSIKPFDVKSLMRCPLKGCNHTVKLIEKGENRSVFSVKYVRDGVENEAIVDVRGNIMGRGADIDIYLNGTKYQVHVQRISIFSARPPIEPVPIRPIQTESKAGKPPVFRGLEINLVRITGNLTAEYYELNYTVRDPSGNLSIFATLFPRKDGYIASTLVRYSPVNKRVESLEFVNISGPVKLSEMYKMLSDTAERLSKVYERGNKTVREQLVPRYLTMARHLKHLAGMIENMWIDKPVLNAKAIISDDSHCKDICELAWLVVCIPATLASGGLGLFCFVVAQIFCTLVCWNQ